MFDIFDTFDTSKICLKYFNRSSVLHNSLANLSSSNWYVLSFSINSEIQTRTSIIQSFYALLCLHSWWGPWKAVDHPSLSSRYFPHIENHQKFGHNSPQFIRETVNFCEKLCGGLYGMQTNTDGNTNGENANTNTNICASF